MFRIQVCNPHILDKSGEIYPNFRDAIEEIFPLLSEKLILYWNTIPVPLCYKYDISVIWDEIRELIAELISQEKGKCTIIWPSDTFRTDWKIEWDSDTCNIVTSWIDVHGGIESHLNENNNITMSKNDFLAEWKSLLLKMKYAIEASGCQIENSDEVSELNEMINTIPFEGELYRE